MRHFGLRIPGQIYQDRPSVYAIIPDQNGQIAAVEARGALFLPGGGIEPGETEEQALNREIYEETGRRAILGRCLAEAAEYVTDLSRSIFVRKLGRFYIAKFESTENRSIGPGGQHPLVWVNSDQFESGAAHRSQVWVVKKMLAADGEQI